MRSENGEVRSENGELAAALWLSVLRFQFSVLSSPFSLLTSHFSVLRSPFYVLRSKVVLNHSADAVVGHLAQVVVVSDSTVDLKVAVGYGGQLVFKANVESLGVVTY